ncbi:hypothetical protein FSARC_13853, partial [Fusarium sarcochroum]
MGRRALTAQEKEERQRQRQESRLARQTLELAQEYALDPNLRVVIDRALPTLSGSRTTTAIIGSLESTSSMICIGCSVDPPAPERPADPTTSEPPNMPAQLTAQQDEVSHNSSLAAKLSALDIGGDHLRPSSAAPQSPIISDPTQAPLQPSPIRQNGECHHQIQYHSSPLDSKTEVSLPRNYATQPAAPGSSSPSIFYQDDHSVSELPSPSSHPPDTQDSFTSSSLPSSRDSDDPTLDGFLRSINEKEATGGADFLREQSGVYDKVFRSFFARECECPRSCEVVEPEHTHTLQERTEYIQRSLPPLQSVFAELGAETNVNHHAQQEIPSSYNLIYAKSRAYQESPGSGRWTADDESRTFRLGYSVPAEFLSRLWASIVQKANSHQIQTLRGKAIHYYRNPYLLFQAHDLKNVFAQPNLQESLVLFRDAILAGLNPEQLDLRSCWLDLGMRDHIRRQHQGQAPSPTDQSGQHGPWTLLWKSACCRHLHRRLGDIAPDVTLDARYYRSSLLRDAGTYYAKAKPTKSSNPGHPEARSPGIIRAKAYDCKKELFGVMFSDYKLFSSGFLPLLAFDEEMLKDLAGMDQNRQRAFAPQLSRSHLVRAWDANKRHLRAASSAQRHPNFGIRKEVTFRLDIILTMMARGVFQSDQNTHTGPMIQEIPLNPAHHAQHYPYWIVPTSVMKNFICTQAARFILPLDDIFQ